MADNPNQHSQSPRVGAQNQTSSEELRREHQLVRSAGAISKPVMALAFGLVFLLVAALAAGPFGEEIWALILGPIGAVSVAWAIFVWARRCRQQRRQHGDPIE